MNITKQIAAAIGENPVPEKNDSQWTMFDDGGVETEVGEFLYGLVRANKPKRILETGTYSAISSMYLGLALKDNGFGNLDTVEYEEVHIQRAKKRLIALGLQNIVIIHNISSLNFEPQGIYDLMFLDTELNIRFHELVKFFPNLKPGGFVFIHDLPINLCQGNTSVDHPEFKHWPVGEIPSNIKQLVNNDKLRPFHLGNARGMLGFYKPQEGEYKW